jgi:hypothetical protein
MTPRTNGGRPIVHTDGAPDNPATDGKEHPEESPLERAQHKERDKNFGREQGGNQEGNQRGVGNPGDR